MNSLIKINFSFVLLLFTFLLLNTSNIYAQPIAYFDPDSLDYGNVSSGDKAIETIYLHNDNPYEISVRLFMQGIDSAYFNFISIIPFDYLPIAANSILSVEIEFSPDYPRRFNAFLYAYEYISGNYQTYLKANLQGTGIIPPQLTVTPLNRTVGDAGGSTTFSITSNTNWTATDNTSWLTLKPTSGSGDTTLTANYDANPTTAQRVGTITVTGGGITRNVTVTQAAGSPTLIVSPSNRSVTNSAGNTTFTVTSNTSWSATENTSWLRLNYTSGSGDTTLTANYDANPTTAQRVDTITVTGGGITRNVTVTQAAGSPTLIVSPSNRSVTNSAGNTTFTVTSNTSWSATENTSWLRLNYTSGSGDTTLTANYDANPTTAQRVDTITVTGGGITRNVTVTQAAGSSTLIVSPSNRSVTNSAGNTTFTVTSNTSWSATENTSWLRLNYTSGSGDTTLTANYDANPTTAQRVDTITVTGGGITRNVTVTQAAGSPTLIVSPSNRSVTNSAGNTTFTVTSNTSWSATENTSWLRLNYTSGSGDTTLTANYDANPTTAQRVDTITVTGGGITRNVTVTQAAGSSTLIVSPSNRSVTNSAGNTTFTVTSNTSWSATENTSWLRLNYTSGSGDTTLTANYDANPTTAQRVGTITVTGGGITRNVTVTQAAGSPTLIVSPSNRSVTNSAGNTTFTVTSNTSWSATENTSWLRLNYTSGSGDTTLTANYDANPTTAQRVGTITVTGGGITRNVTVTQAAGSSTLIVSPSNRSVTNSAGNTTFTVTSNTSWSATENTSWLRLNYTSGSGDTTLTANYDANPTTAQRVGTITVTGGGITRNVTVTQAAGSSSLTVSPSDRPVTILAGSTTFTVLPPIQAGRQQRILPG